MAIATLKFAVLGIEPNRSFGNGGHTAYWDGWYSDRWNAEAVAEVKRKQSKPEGQMIFVVVQMID